MFKSEQEAPKTHSAGPGDSSGSPKQRGRVIKSLALLAAVITVLALINLARLNRLTGDQFTLLAVVQYEQNPAGYAADGLFRDPSWYQAYLPWYRALTVQLTRWTGDGAVAMWVMSVSLTAAMALAFWLLFYLMKVDPMLATVGAIIGILPRVATCSELTGAGILETALPRTFFSAGLPLAILLILKSQGRLSWSVAGFFLIGLLGNFHPQSAFFATAGLLLLMLAKSCTQWRGWLQVSVCGLAALVGILPFGFTYPWEATSTSAEQKVERLDALQSLFVAGGNAVPEVEDESLESLDEADQEDSITMGEESLDLEDETPATASTSKTLAGRILTALRLMNQRYTFYVFTLAVLPMMLGVRLLRSDQDDSTSDSVRTARLCYLAAVLIGCLSLGGEFLNRLLSTWSLGLPFLDSVQPLRATRLIAPLCVVAFILLISKARGLESFTLRRVRWALLLLLFPVPVSLAAGEYVFQTRYRPVEEAARWARENTEPGTLFLVDPPSAIAFRVWAKRPVVWAHHDAVCVSTPLRSQVRQEIKDIERAFKANKPRRLLRLARDYQASYVHYPGEISKSLPPHSYQEGPFLSLESPRKTTHLASPPQGNEERIR